MKFSDELFFNPETEGCARLLGLKKWRVKILFYNRDCGLFDRFIAVETYIYLPEGKEISYQMLKENIREYFNSPALRVDALKEEVEAYIDEKGVQNPCKDVYNFMRKDILGENDEE